MAIRNPGSRSHHGRLVKILERPAGQQFAPFQGLLESGIAVGYVFLPGAQFVACKLAPQPIWASRAHPRWACRSPPAAQGSEAGPAARNTLASARIPRASKLLICGLFQKGRVLAQDGVHLCYGPVTRSPSENARRAVWTALANFATSSLGMLFTFIPDRPAPSIWIEPSTNPIR